MDKTSYNAGKAQGQAEEKGNQVLKQAGDLAQSAKEGVINAGVVVKDTTLGAVDAVKNATGLK